MNYKTIAILLVIISLLLINIQACRNDSKEVIFDAFPIEKDLISHNIDWIDNNVIASMHIYDSILLILDMYNKHFLYFYNINSKKFLGSYGPKGKGPNEFIADPIIFPTFYNDDKEIYFQLIDKGKNELCDVKLFASLELKKLIYAKTFMIPPEMSLKKYYFLNDSIFAGTMDNKNGSLFLYNINKDRIIKWQKRTKFKANVHPDHKFAINSERIWISPDKNKIVGAFLRLKIINIYNNHGELVKIVKDREQPELDFSSINIEDIHGKNPEYYNDVVLSDDYILIKNRRATFETAPNINTEILVFNYSGQAVARYQLDQSILSPAVDWNKNVLYAYDFNNDKCVYYNLEGL